MKVSIEDMRAAQFVVRDGWYGVLASPSYAFQCGDLSERTVYGTAREMERNAAWLEYDLDNLSDNEIVEFECALETLQRAVKHGWETDE